MEGDAKEKKEGEGEGGAEGEEEEGKEKAEESGSKDWGLMSYLRNSLFNKKTPTEGEAKDEGELKEVKVEGGDDSNKQVYGH